MKLKNIFYCAATALNVAIVSPVVGVAVANARHIPDNADMQALAVMTSSAILAYIGSCAQTAKDAFLTHKPQREWRPFNLKHMAMGALLGTAVIPAMGVTSELFRDGVGMIQNNISALQSNKSNCMHPS